ncbi:LuxR C-terminal-related transcriptional regulator [Bacillus swezeyi]|uniref:helix-turn-helix transcriptional regulator n=1 Tax=Bacillus swezeyi TaxID=1925020 RepID=UPI002E1EB86D|nr:LuxR C-terminal-related transcriptional regulator [Bacillus swezeyi]
MDRKQIEDILKNYRWMMNSIEDLRRTIDELRELNRDVGEGLTAKYGIEAALPKAQGTTSDSVYNETVRRSKRYKKIEIYEQKVQKLQERINRITDEREGEVLHWLLEGKSYRWIAQHMQLSFSHIRNIRDSIIDKLANESNCTNCTKGTNFKNLQSAG